MKIVTLIVRVLLGGAFVVFGANILHPFLPMPPPPEGSLMAQFVGVMFPTHWMALVGAFQLMGGLLVLSGRMAPLGLVFLGPILVNILACHVCLMGGEGIGGGVAFSILEIFLIYAYRSYFLPFFKPYASPTD